MSTTETIYVALLGEGIDVWRPVKARRIAEETYVISDQTYDRPTEIWQFGSGTVVRCEIRTREGRRAPFAVAAVPNLEKTGA